MPENNRPDPPVPYSYYQGDIKDLVIEPHPQGLIAYHKGLAESEQENSDKILYTPVCFMYGYYYNLWMDRQNAKKI